MRVVTPAGEVIELGTVETSPTIGMVDYSRRETDDFGVTTVVERGFSRLMSVRLAVPFDDTGALQRRLAALRATAATWIADDRFASLSVRGFYKDFEVDHAVPPLSYCKLTVEGLAEDAPIADAGGDPAVSGTSTLQLLQPVQISAANLIASTVPEADAAEWSAQTTYALGARVMKAATHRVYEAAIGGNVGNDPAGTSGKWIDTGPTNRWAMFDQALGSMTSAAGAIAVTLDAPQIQAVALLDVTAATVRLQAIGYDRTLAAGAGATTFLDLPAGTSRVTVTIAGGSVSVGTMLIGKLVGLGVTEASPTSGITDYSRKDVDQFGAVTIVERAWAKRMSAKSLIDTAAIDVVANRIAAVRATPALWIGLDGLDSLTVYGFFKEFSIEVGETTSKLSLSIEGLSVAANIPPFDEPVNWDDIADPTGTKPTDNADKTSDNTSKDTNAVGGQPAADVILKISKIAPIAVDVANLDKAVVAANATLDGLKADAARTDVAIGALERVDDLHDQALQDLRESAVTTDAALVALAGADVDADAARRQIVRDTGRIEEALLRAVMESARTREVLRDAGIAINPNDGTVRIYAIEQLADRAASTEIKLDAQAATITQKASVNFVREQIALAVLDPAQAAQLEPILARLTSAETEIDGSKAAIALKAEAIELTRVSGKVSSVETVLDALSGVVSTKASSTRVDQLETLTGSIVQELSALPDVSGLSITIRQARAVADDSAEAALRGLLSGDSAVKRQIVQVAELREEAFTRIDTGLAAEALARRTLSVEMLENSARVVEELRALTTEDSVQGSRIEALAVTTERQASAIARLDEVAIDAAGGIAGTRTTIRQQAANEKTTAEALLRALLAGDETGRAARAQLVQVQQEATTRLVAGELSAASTKQLLEARIGSAEAFAASTTSILADVTRAQAKRIDALDVSFGDLGDDVAATNARIVALDEATAEADRAIAESSRELAAQVNNPDTGLPKTRAQLIEEREASAERDAARVRDISALGITAEGQAAAIARLDEASIGAAGGIAGVSTIIRQVSGNADDAGEAMLRALIAGDDASRERQRQIVEVASQFTTTLIANELSSVIARQSLLARISDAQASIFDVSKALATTEEALVERISAAEAVFNNAATGLPATLARLIREERLRTDGDEANAEATAVLSAQVNNPDTGLPAAIAQIARYDQASAERDRVQVQSIDEISAELRDPASGLAATSARIVELGTAIVDADHAQTQRVDQVAADFSKRNATRANLQRNGGFENGIAGIGHPDGVAVADDPAHGRVLRWTLNNDTVIFLPPINVAPGAPYTVGFDAMVNVPNGAGELRLDVTTFTGPNATGVATAGQIHSDFMGHGTSPDVRRSFSFTAPQGCASIQLVPFSRAVVNASDIFVRRLKVEQGLGPATAYSADAQLASTSASVTDLRAATASEQEAIARRVEQVNAALTDPATGLPAVFAAVVAEREASLTRDAANGRSVEQVTARLDGVGGVTIEDAIEAVVTRVGKIIGTRTTAIDINGNLVGTQLVGSDEGRGALNLINADLRMGTGRILFDNGSYMLVQGVGFGAANDLLDWYGPTRSVETCSPANAISFKSLDGRERMGGALNNGVVGYDQLQLGAAQKAAFHTIPDAVVIQRNATVRVVGLTFVKEDTDSILEITFNGDFFCPDDLQFTASIGIDDTTIKSTRVNIILVDGNASMPITPFAYATGIAAGPHTVTFTATNNEADNAALTISAGSTIKVVELRKGSIGSSTGSGAVLVSSGGGSTGGGTGGGGGYVGIRPPQVNDQ